MLLVVVVLMTASVAPTLVNVLVQLLSGHADRLRDRFVVEEAVALTGVVVVVVLTMLLVRLVLLSTTTRTAAAGSLVSQKVPQIEAMAVVVVVRSSVVGNGGGRRGRERGNNVAVVVAQAPQRVDVVRLVGVVGHQLAAFYSVLLVVVVELLEPLGFRR